MVDAPAPQPASAPGVISVQTAAALLMVTPEWIRRLVKDGWINKVGRDQYRLQDVVQGYIKYLRDEGRQTSKSASASAVQIARAEEVKVRTDERTGRLLREAETKAIDIVSEFAGGLRSDLLAIPARFTMDLKQREKLAQDIDRAFADAARKAAAAASLVADARSRLDAAGKHRTKAVGRGKSKVSGKHRPSRAAKP